MQEAKPHGLATPSVLGSFIPYFMPTFFGALFPYPGKIIPMHLDELGGELICQKDAFLCAARGGKGEGSVIGGLSTLFER